MVEYRGIKLQEIEHGQYLWKHNSMSYDPGSEMVVPVRGFVFINLAQAKRAIDSHLRMLDQRGG